MFYLQPSDYGPIFGTAGGARQYVAANNEYHSTADSTSLSTGDIDFTVGVWVYLDSKGTDRGIISQYDFGNDQRSWAIQYYSSGDRIRLLLSSDGISFSILTASTVGEPATGEWYFVVAWHDSVNDTASIQVNNGVIDSVAHASGTLDSTAAFSIGSLFNSGVAAHLFDGRISRAFFTKRVLTTAERTWLYNNGAGRLYSELGEVGTDGENLKTDLEGYWNLNEPFGDAVDSHGSNNLTDNNTVTEADGPGF